MTHYEEHLQDSEFADTWQAAEAAQFIKDEARVAIYDREVAHAEWVAAGRPTLDVEEVEDDDEDLPF